MLKRRQIQVLFLMIILIIVACQKKENTDVQQLSSDKQVQVETLSQDRENDNTQEDNEKSEIASQSQNEQSITSRSESQEQPQTQANSEEIQENVQESFHTPSNYQTIVYTKLNSWNNNDDYYDIFFNQPILESISADDLSKYIEFSPKTKGKYKKVDDKKVRFYPEGRFLGNTDYKVKIEQDKLFNDKFAVVELLFYNASPIMSLGYVALNPTKNQNEYYLEFVINHYRGRYLDSDYIKGMDIFVGGSRVLVDKISYDNSGKMTLKTLPFKASEKDVIVISPDKKLFNLSDNYIDVYYSNSIKEMRKFILHSTRTVTDEQGKARIELTFSKQLAKEQTLDGLITVNNQEGLETTISKFMYKVIITGNFELDKEYTIQIKAGIRAIDNSVLKEDKTKKIHTNNRDPSLKFADNGVFLSSLNDNSINIKVVNHSKIKYHLWAIQVENIAEMIHNIDIVNFSETYHHYSRHNDNLNWYGEMIKSGTIETEVITNKDSFIKLDLGNIVTSDPNKIYILNLNGNIENHFNSLGNGYIWPPGASVSKMLLFTDLAITAKAFKDKVQINVVDVLDGSPVKRADVELRAYNNNLLASGRCDNKGQLIFDELVRPLDNGQFFVIAKKRASLGFLSSESMYIDNTKFNIERDFSQSEYKLEVFLDRTEYRPGETVNLSVMVRDSDNNIVKEEIPLIVTIYDPQNSKISSEKITDYKEGFVVYKYSTQENTNTGNWRMEIEFGSIKKFANFSIETFVPERINVTLESNKQAYNFEDKYLELKLKNTYLFGAPLVGAKCQLYADFNNYYGFAQGKFSEYSFLDEFTSSDYSIFNQEQELESDQDGVIKTAFKLLEAKESNHPYYVNLRTKITEEGGRPIERTLVLPVSPRQEYIGLSSNRYLKPTDGQFRIPVVLVDESGTKLKKGVELEYVVYGRRGSWWWDYDYNYNVSYKNSESNIVIEKGITTIGKDGFITFTPQTSDFHLFIVEAKIKGKNDYQINKVYYNSYWGDNTEISEDSSLELKTDKDEYQVGDKVKISIPSSKNSKIYLKIIKKDEVIKQEIINVTEDGDYIYEFKTNDSFAPNVFVDVRVIQGQKDKNNDLPLRLFGLISVKVIDKSSRLEVKLDLPEKINSNSMLKAKIDVGIKKKTQYLVSIVDQGLVNRSKYSMPNPWNFFYGPQGYFAQDYDNFSFFVNAQNQEIFRTIMIGGDIYDSMVMSAERMSQGGAFAMLKEMNRLQETGAQRFKPVSYFLGILETDDNGKGEFEVKIDDYIGALKVTVIAANDEAIGSNVKNVIVKDDIIAMPTLPRVLTPNDEFQIPVNVVIDSIVSSEVEIELLTNSLVEVTSKSKQIIPSGVSSKLLIFSAKVKENIGKAEFNLRINSKEFKSEKKISVGVRLPSAYQTDSQMLSFEGDDISFTVPDLGYGNSSQTYLSFAQGFDFNADEHLRYSIRYPYGGAVMKTAGTFVQLLLADFLKDDNLRNELDANINAYFQEIVKFNNKGLWTWQGNSDKASKRKILNAYALHTFLLAKEKGYNINEFVYSEILDFLQKSAISTSTVKFEDAYILYVLALADKANIASLNYYNEQESIIVQVNAKTMLEMAYQESGFAIKDITKDLKAKVILQLEENNKSYLEPNEDVSLALDLYFNSIFNNSDSTQKAKNRDTALALSKKMQSPDYWNSYDKGWNLFALAGFVSTLPANYQDYNIAEFELSMADKSENIKVDDLYILNLSSYKNKEIKIKAISDNAKDVMISVNNVYVPKIGTSKAISNNINLEIIYTDLNGKILDVSSLEQGESFYAEILTSTNFKNMEFATTYILPSAWEFSSEKVEYNYYNRNDRNERPSYIDVRDDRVIIYGKNSFNLPVLYKCKINVITKGKFMMPASTSEDLYNSQNQALVPGKTIQVGED